MPIKITLRTDKNNSPFHHLLNALLKAPGGDSAVICSGYVWESRKYSVLNDNSNELLKSLSVGCKKRLVTVAGKFNPAYYRMFYGQFVARLVAAGINVHAKYAPRKNWHAKLAIRLKGDEPIAILVGSSNLTRPAYGENWRNWNYEADVLIWGNSLLSPYFQQIDIGKPRLGYFETVLNPEVHGVGYELEQMRLIYNEIISESEEFSQ